MDIETDDDRATLLEMLAWTPTEKINSCMVGLVEATERLETIESVLVEMVKALKRLERASGRK